MIILGCGYVGAALARQTLAAGQPVSALTRNAARAGELRAQGVSPVVVADLASEDWHASLNPAGETIANCVSPGASGPEGYRHSFIEGAKSVAYWLKKSTASGQAPARTLVFTSSTGVYPQTEGELVDEMTPVDVASLSAAGKILRETEDIFLALPRQLSQRSWVLRLGGLYGPNRHQLLDALRENKKTFPGGGSHWLNLLHRDDAVDAIQACLQAPQEIPAGIFNVVDDEPVLKRDLVAWLATKLGGNPAEIQFTGETRRATHRLGASGKIPHRRIANTQLKQMLGWHTLYPSYRDGYNAILASNGKA